MKDIRQAYQQKQWPDVVKAGQAILNNQQSTDEQKKEAYLLLGSALKQSDEIQKAIKILEKGIKHYPDLPGLYHNLGNCYKQLGTEGKWPAIRNYLKAQELGLKSGALALALSRCLQSLSFYSLAYQCLTDWIRNKNPDEEPTAEALIALIELAGTVLEETEADSIGAWCLDSFGEQETLEGQASMAIYKARLGETKEANEWFELAKKTLESQQKNIILSPSNSKKDIPGEQMLINAGWNLACSLLKKGDMQTGWKLYNYGLHTPAPGLQRWQRAFHKPFSIDEVPVWNGEKLKDKSILVLGEQAVGDSMMFLQLLPVIHKECKNVSIAIPERLCPIYERTYPDIKVYNDERPDLLPSSNHFDFQIPSGSLPYLRLQQWFSRENWLQQKLKPNPEKVSKLKEKYRYKLEKGKPLIGISWSGGGKADRIRAKSLTNEQFAQVLRSLPHARFVSLQYGNAEPTVQGWQHEGFDVIYDNNINALDNMDDWLAQVDACDAVISVANTTIHGAGGLQKPTFCIQGRNSDWRWIEGLNHSYWYESVSTSWQARDGSWSDAINEAKEWITNKNYELNPTQKNLTIQSILSSMTFTTPG